MRKLNGVSRSLAGVSSKQVRQAITLAKSGLVSIALFFSSVALGNTSDIQCQFTPYLKCSDGAHIDWINTRFTISEIVVAGGDQVYFSQNNRVIGLDSATGKLRWQHAIDKAHRYFQPVYQDGSVYLARSDGRLEKREAQTGKLHWVRSLGKGWVYPPVLIGDRVITGGQIRLIWQLDKDTGAIEHTVSLSQELVAPLIANDDIFVASTFDGYLNAFTPNQNKSAWKIRASAPSFSMLVDENKLIAANMDGQIQSISLESGEIHWTKALYSDARYWIMRQNDTLITVDHAGSIYALNTDTGMLLSQHMLNHQITQAPIAQHDSLVLFDTNGFRKRIQYDVLEIDRRPSSQPPTNEEL